MTDNEIIKALECCTKDDNEPNCKECPKEMHIYCMCELLKDAFDLIKQQQEHIEVLEAMTTLRNKRKYYNRFVKEVWQKEKGELSYPDFDEIYRRYFEQQKHMDKIASDLKWWLDTNEENGVVYIPKFVVEKIVRGETDDK